MKCDFPPCDENATWHVVAKCECGSCAWDARVCAEHLVECERVARLMLEPSHTVTVVSL